MPRLITKIEGRGNGIKTVIVNMSDIAKALHVDPAYPTKYFGIDLGAQSMYNAKTDKAVVNGCFQSEDMQKIMTKFIDDFILCPTCRYPEIKMIVKKTRIKIDCAACGHTGNVNTKHKLVMFILKDHADETKTKKKDKKKAEGDKEGEDGEKKTKKKSKEDEAEDEEEDEEGDKKPKEEKGDKKKKKKEEEAELVWSTDTSKEAQKLRKAEEFASMKANEFLKDVEEIIQSAGADNDQSASTVLKVFLASGKRTITQIVNEVKRLQLARGLDEPQKIKVLLEAVIDITDVNKVAGEYKQNAELLKRFAVDKPTRTILLNCIEEQVGVVNTKLLPRTPIIVQALYEADVLDEDTILAWYESPPESSWLVNKDVAVAVRRRAQPLIKWLKEADEEEEED